MDADSVLLLVGMECAPEAEERFNEWYNEHIPIMLKFPGMKAATRYKITEANEEYPSYLAIYEFQNQQALEEYKTSPERAEAQKHAEERRRAEDPGEKNPYLRWRVTYRALKTWSK